MIKIFKIIAFSLDKHYNLFIDKFSLGGAYYITKAIIFDKNRFADKIKLALQELESKTDEKLEVYLMYNLRGDIK